MTTFKICGDHHVEIVWEEGNVCPLCSEKEKVKQLERDIEGLQ